MDGPFRTDGRLGKVHRFVTAHLSEKIPVERAAYVACLEVRYFSAYFRRKTGSRYTNWLQCLRVHEAIRRMEVTGCTLERAAAAVGFRTRRSFQRAFKRWIGLCPTDYRRTRGGSKQTEDSRNLSHP